MYFLLCTHIFYHPKSHQRYSARTVAVSFKHKAQASSKAKGTDPVCSLSNSATLAGSNVKHSILGGDFLCDIVGGRVVNGYHAKFDSFNKNKALTECISSFTFVKKPQSSLAKKGPDATWNRGTWHTLQFLRSMKRQHETTRDNQATPWSVTPFFSSQKL